MLESGQVRRAAVEPWFRQRPRTAVAVAALLFAGVLVLRLAVGTPTQALSLLYVLPVALMAVVFGTRGGLASGLVAVCLTEVWVLHEGVSLGVVGWLSRAFPLLLLGLLLGQATDRVRRAEAEQRRLARAALLHREAIEINDSLIQGMAAAKWSLEAGCYDAGLHTLEVTITSAQEHVSSLIRDAAMGPTGAERPVTKALPAPARRRGW